ncbi:SHOCT domain-containing protein [Chloroflexota bacterium]
MGGAWMLLFWGVIIALIVWVVKKVTNRDDSTKKQSPLDIARERYAKGEISKDEFEQLKKDSLIMSKNKLPDSGEEAEKWLKRPKLGKRRLRFR